MQNQLHFYIDGQWVLPSGTQVFELIDPATEKPMGRVALGDAADVDRAAKAARRAFAAWSNTDRAERLALLQKISAGFQSRAADLAAAVSREMGCPRWLAEQAQVPYAGALIPMAVEELKNFQFEQTIGKSLVRKEAIGVAALITPWNWPLLTLMNKLMPALACGCTVVVKPSEYTPHSTRIVAEILHDAGLPPGVFNLVYGDGPTVGTALSTHPDVDIVSITGSTRAGSEVARNAAASVKRVHQELGGKSPNLLLEGADFEKAVTGCLRFITMNSGQSCMAPTRLLVPRARQDEVVAMLRKMLEAVNVGPPDSGAVVGPVINASQFEKIQGLIAKGIEEGARLVAGGTGRPQGLEKGYYVKPTVFADVTASMTIAQEEIFGPVLVIQPYDSVEDAVRIANDTRYGLAAYVHAANVSEALAVGARIRAGQVYLNGDLDIMDLTVPFGGCKMSGNGREGGAAGFESFLEEISYMGYYAATAVPTATAATA